MKASRIRTVSSSRRGVAASPVASEVLEGRRLFAAFAPDHGHAGPATDPGVVYASRTPPMVSWQSQLAAAYRAALAAQTAANAAATTAAAGDGPAVETSAVASATSASTSVPVRFVTTPATSLQARTSDAAPPAAANVIEQVMNTPATTAAFARSADAGAAGDAGQAFGSYTVKLADAGTGRTKTIESGLIDLLTVNATRDSRLAAWHVEAGANARRVTAAETSADAAEGELPTINSDDVVLQAALPILPGDVSMRPLWQRVALFTATGVIFAANWVIRRKQRKLALALKA